jgi:NADH-quinone oxidoreductase subunit E
MAEELIEKIVDRYEKDRDMLIPMLQDLQAEMSYLPPEKLKVLAQVLDLPLIRVYGVATFYSSFRLAPKGNHDITLCMGTVCFLKGADKISEALCEEFNVKPGGTTEDRLFTYQPVNCVGACALAPVMLVDGKYHDHMTPDSAIALVRDLSSVDAEVKKAGKEGT